MKNYVMVHFLAWGLKPLKMRILFQKHDCFYLGWKDLIGSWFLE
jgi:hypothetical protein